MAIKYKGLSEINGSLIVLDNVEGAAYDEVASIRLSDGTTRVKMKYEIPNGDMHAFDVLDTRIEQAVRAAVQ